MKITILNFRDGTVIVDDLAVTGDDLADELALNAVFAEHDLSADDCQYMVTEDFNLITN